MELSDKVRKRIINELSRISKIIFDGVPNEEAQDLAYIMNQLLGLYAGRISISDFHEKVDSGGKAMREFYYELLFEEK